MRAKPFHVWLLIVCLLAGRFALAAHDAQHAAPNAGAHACVACVLGGGPDAVAASLSLHLSDPAAPAFEHAVEMAEPAPQPRHRYNGRAPPSSLV